MKVFISWSGQTSREVAKLLSEWIEDVLQGVETWYSPDDIEKGSMWFSEIHQTLGENNVGILCVTPENKNAPWILFEAGALFKGLTKARVCPLLIGNQTPADITAPLAHFNLTLPEEQDMLRLMRTVNSANENPLDDDRLEKAFNRWWQDFKSKYDEIVARKPEATAEKRSTPDLLTEILEGVRHIQRSLPPTRTIEDASSVVGNPYRKPAVSVLQESSHGDAVTQRGRMKIRVLRQTVLVTGSGKFAPEMSDVPFVTAVLEAAPEGYSPELVQFRCGTGTTFDFNITLKSTAHSIPLLVGEYVFSYEATVQGSSSGTVAITS